MRHLRRVETRTLAVALLAALAAFGSHRQGFAADPEELADRLLRAELLEVSTGDVERALEIYRAIQAEESAPESVRARALLYMARCHRKLGELQKSKELLEQLVKNHAEERELLRQARSFLRELQTGKTENPDFDWFRELERSPEIQARVFDLAMDLVDVGADEGLRAWRQLLALGTIASPVLERMIETSRDANHRRNLAWVLLQFGRYEYLKVVLDPKEPPSTGRSYGRGGELSVSRKRQNLIYSTFRSFLLSLADLNDSERAGVLAALDGVAKDEAIEPYSNLIRLFAGDRKQLDLRLRSVERFESTYDVSSLYERILDAEPQAARLLAARILEPDCDKSLRRHYVRLLETKDPGRLTKEHWILFIADELRGQGPRIDSRYQRLDFERLSGPYVSIAELDSRRAWDVLREFARAEVRAHILNYFWQRYAQLDELSEASAEWTGVLRAIGSLRRMVPGKTAPTQISAPFRSPVGFQGNIQLQGGIDALHIFAERDDRAIPELVRALRERREKTPDYTGYPIRYYGEDWRPSAAYVAAMIPLVEVDDPVVRAIALEALSLATDGAREPAAAAAKKTLEASGDLRVRELALYALFKLRLGDEASRPDLARALFDEFENRMSVETVPENYREPLLQYFITRGRGRRPRSSRGARGLPDSWEEISEGQTRGLYWIPSRMERSAIELLPDVLELSATPNGAAMHTWYFNAALDQHPDSPSRTFLGEILGVVSRSRGVASQFYGEYRRFFMDQIGTGDAQVVELWKALVDDHEVAVEIREAAMRDLILKRPASEVLDSFEWNTLLRSEDPIAHGAFKVLQAQSLGNLPADERASLYEAALASPQPSLRGFVVESFPDGEDLLTVLETASRDPAEAVRGAVIDRVSNLARADAGTILLTLLEDPEPSVRRQAANVIGVFTLPESIEPLTKLLDDPDIRVRQVAASALKSVREALAQKKEWKQFLEDVRKKAASEQETEPAQEEGTPEKDKKDEAEERAKPGEAEPAKEETKEEETDEKNDESREEDADQEKDVEKDEAKEEVDG